MKVHVKSFGCSANMADGGVLAGCLSKAGYTLADTETQADVIIFNSCAVKGPTENRVINAIKQVPKNKKIIIAGCLPKISLERLQKEVRFDGIVGAAVGSGIVDVVARVWAGEHVEALEGFSKPSLNLPKIASNPIISVIPINYGCLGSCSYCCVVFARGHLRSYTIEEIAQRVKTDFVAGTREFWLTSQDTACFGRESGSNLAQLLKALDGLQGDFWLRVGMMTPNMVFDMQNPLISAFGSERVFKFVHLPVQSGDNLVLKGMRRFYTVEQFKAVVDAFRQAYPKLTVATDVIVGFPGETQQAFQNTLKLMEETKFDVVNVSKFFARPKTAAAKITEGIVEPEEIKRRSTVAAQLAKQVSLGQNQRWIGWVGEVLVDEKGKKAGSWVGRNFAYKPIVIKSKSNLFGKTVKVKIDQATSTYLKATLNKD
jgi:threonylcarbamoyladenosine tRNA methylthiotransferase CDKAL1